MISELILFCEAIFEFLLSKASIAEEQKSLLNSINYSKRMFETDKQTVLETMLNSILQEDDI